MNTKIIGISIAVVVSLVVMAGVLIPVLEDAEHSGAESHSNGNILMNKATSTTDMIVASGGNVISDGHQFSGYDYSLIVSDNFWMFITAGGANIFWFDGNDPGWSAIKGANVKVTPADKTIELTDITFADSNNNLTEHSLTIAYDQDCFYRSVNGSYANVKYTSISDVRVLEDSEIYAAGYASNKLYYWNGTSVTVNGDLSETPGVITLTDSTPSDFKTVAISYTPEGGSAVSPSTVIVPAEIWTAGDLNDSMLGILGAIPVLIIVAILVGVVAAVFTRRE